MFKRFSRTLGAAPTTSGQLGYNNIVVNGTTSSIAANITASIYDISVPSGTWYIGAGYRVNNLNVTTTTQLSIGISFVANYLTSNSPLTVFGGVGNTFGNSSTIVSGSSASTWYLVVQNNNSQSFNFDSIYVALTRIA